MSSSFTHTEVSYPGSGHSSENAHDLLQDRREGDRFKSLHSVRWDHRDYENRQGKIRDISSTGIFLTPLGAVPEGIKHGDAIAVALCINEKEYVFSTKVRWFGKSKIHGELGFGLEFDEKTRKDQNNL